MDGLLAMSKHAKRKPGEKAGLTDAQIITQALVLLKQNSELSVAGIAAALGVFPTAVYARFSGGLDEILTEMVRTLLANVARPPQPNENWENYLRGIFRAVYSAFHKHPRAARFAVSRIAADFYLNPLLVERILFALSLAGVPEGERADALDLVMGSLISMLAIEYAGLRSTSPLKWLRDLPDASNGQSAGEYPQISTLKDKLIFAIKLRNTQVRFKPGPVRPQRFADCLLAGLKANFSIK
jgi:AcrR family transcriptional regulator